MPYPLPLTRTEAYLAYKAGVIQQSDLKPSLAVPRNGIDAWLAYWTGLAADYPKREDGTTHILQEEEAYIAYLCGVINEYPEKCLRRVGAYLRYLISARWGRPDHPTNREELYLSLIKTQFIPSGDPSSDIVIDGTAKAPFVDVKMYGDTAQNSYTGKNLVDTFRFENYSLNGVELRIEADGSIVLNGTSTASGNIRADVTDIFENRVGEQLTYSVETSGTGLFSNFGLKTPNASISGNVTPTEPTRTVALGESSTGKYVADVYFDGIKTFDNFVIKIQIEAGSTATSYEPYVGGTPSPNPDYPQQIQTVTGEQVVEIVGKNLFDETDQSILRNRRLSTSTGGTYGESGWSISPLIKVVPGNKYTVGGVGQTSYYCWYKDGAYISGSGVVPNGQILVPSGVNQIKFDYPTANEAQIQFELGSTATAYTAYSKQTYPIDLGTIELCNIGTYQDYIYKDGDSWKVHKEIGKVTLDGSETWTKASANSGYRFWTSKTTDIKTSIDAVLKANRLGVAQGDTWEYDGISGSYSTAPIRLFIRDALFNDMTVAQLQDWLATHNIIAYYALATATDTVITDQNLIDQLNALKQGGAEEGTTYIKVSATDPNLPAKLYVEAPKYA